MGAPRLPDLSRPPTGHLAGAADGGEPGWQDRIVDEVFADEGRKRMRDALQIAVRPPIRHLIRVAAERRGMSTSAYVRRAVCAFVATDLQMSFEIVTAYSPPVKADRSFGRRGKPLGSHGPGSDDGRGYGHWHACDGSGCDV